MVKKINRLKKNIRMLKNISIIINESKKIIGIDVYGFSFEFSNLQLNAPLIKKAQNSLITIEDLKNHPMNLGKRWKISEEDPKYKLSDHQERLIITFEKNKKATIYIIPKILKEGEIAAIVTAKETYSPLPFRIKMYVIKNDLIVPIKPRKPQKKSKIIFTTQILGHVQDAAKIILWANKNGTLYKKWGFYLPATLRTKITKNAIQEEGILINKILNDWSYAGGKNFRTGLEFREYFNERDSFSTVAAFVAANISLCLEVAKGKCAIFSTNFRAEAQLIKIINPQIITCGLSHTFLNGKLKERIGKHKKMPRLTQMLNRIQKSLEKVPERIASLGGDVKYIDYYWKLSSEKLRLLDVLLYRTFNFNKNIPPLDNSTQIIQIPMAIPDIKTTKEDARNNITKIIGQKLKKDNKILILTGESEDGFFKKRIESTLRYARSNRKVHVIMPIEKDDKRISDYDFPKNVHAIGFRKDWSKIMAGGDIALIRGSWGEIIDVISSQIVPVITSPGLVPLNADLDTTQFLTQISEERACNTSMLVNTFESLKISRKTINKLLIDFYNLADKHSFQKTIDFALKPEIVNEIMSAYSNIIGGGSYIGELHELLLKNGRVFSSLELKKLHDLIWKKLK